MPTTQSSTADHHAPSQQQLTKEFTAELSIYFDQSLPTKRSRVRHKLDKTDDDSSKSIATTRRHNPKTLTAKSQSSAVPNTVFSSVHPSSSGSNRSVPFGTRKAQKSRTRFTLSTGMSSIASRRASRASTGLAGGEEACMEQVELGGSSEDETEDSDEWNPSEESSSEDERAERGTGASQSRTPVHGRAGQENEERGKGLWARYTLEPVRPEEPEKISVDGGRKLRSSKMTQ